MTETISTNNKTSTGRWLSTIKANPISYFLLFWFIINILQVSLMELTSDEGYYWFYARHLQWGYYDHPPMIALMIKLGSYLFRGELGVRFMNVLFSTAAIYAFFKLLPSSIKETKKTFLVLLSAPLVHYLTFIVFPDGPLLFFSLLFLLVYKQFLENEKFTTAFLLGVTMALMAWSKYHGALVVLFTMTANPKLLKSSLFWLSLCMAFILFSPHIWWQYQHNFPTLQYHLSGRTGSYSFQHVGEYLSQQVVAIGPGLIFIPFISKAENIFERTLLFIAIGTLGFFLISSFKTFVHFHWTSIAIFPILYFAVLYYNQPTKSKLFSWLILPFVFLFFVVRILLAIPFIPNMHVGEDYYHGREAWTTDIAKLAGNRPVFMPNNLREASLYSFYSGKVGVTLYNRPEKKSQYELWGYEDSLQGKEIVFISKYPHSGGKPLANSLQQSLYYSILPKFQSYYTRVGMKQTLLEKDTDTLRIALEIFNNGNKSMIFNDTTAAEPLRIFYTIEKEKEEVRGDEITAFYNEPIASLKSDKKILTIPLNHLPPGEYTIYFGIRKGVIPQAILSSGEAIDIQ